MKKSFVLWSLSLVLMFSYISSYAQFDDLYYDPETYVVEEEVVVVKKYDNDGDYYNEYEDEYYDDDYDDYYYDDDYYTYSTRIKRFHRHHYFDYYDPFFYGDYYSPGISVYVTSGYYYRPWRHYNHFSHYNSWCGGYGYRGSYWNGYYDGYYDGMYNGWYGYGGYYGSGSYYPYGYNRRYYDHYYRNDRYYSNKNYGPRGSVSTIRPKNGNSGLASKISRKDGTGKDKHSPAVKSDVAKRGKSSIGKRKWSPFSDRYKTKPTVQKDGIKAKPVPSSRTHRKSDTRRSSKGIGSKHPSPKRDRGTINKRPRSKSSDRYTPRRGKNSYDRGSRKHRPSSSTRPSRGGKSRSSVSKPSRSSRKSYTPSRSRSSSNRSSSYRPSRSSHSSSSSRVSRSSSSRSSSGSRSSSSSSSRRSSMKRR